MGRFIPIKINYLLLSARKMIKFATVNGLFHSTENSKEKIIHEIFVLLNLLFGSSINTY